MAGALRLTDPRVDILAVVVSRAAMFFVLFWAAQTSDHESLAHAFILIYGLSTVLYLATWVSAYRSSKASPVGFLLFFQFLVEILLESALFLSGDGYLSDYGLLFILTILSAGIFFQFTGSLAAATLSTAVYGFAGISHLGASVPFGFPLSRLLVETVQLRFFLFCTLFYMVALLSSLLSRRLLAARKELEGSHQALDLYQFSAESMMNDLPTGLLFFDPSGLLKFRNRPVEDWLETTLEPGQPLEGVLGGLLGEEIIGNISHMRESFPYTELEAVTATGRPLHVQIKPLSRGGEYLGCVLTLIDFTHEKKMAQALLRSERMAALGNMSARIAHEIRNPLASISGSAQMLKEAAWEGETDRKLLGLIVAESGRLDRVLTSLLDYARDKPPSYREVSMAEIFRKIGMVLEKNPNFHKELVILHQFIENGDVRFSSDPDILLQVLLNVALNALQALPGGKGELEMRCAIKGTLVVIEVKDNGCGMTQQEVARAFEPFFTTKAHGTGLGLATCHHYVQTLEGTIRLASEKGSGTTAAITLPAREVKTGIGE
jgi:two-component system sensor histidine kinase PilS (NtrC family)